LLSLGGTFGPGQQCLGGHLELTTPLREVMFLVNIRAERKHTITEVF